MLQIAYFSTTAVRQDADTVHSILITSRINNRRDAITGILVAGGNRYLQIIEGPRTAMERLYAAIRADLRHVSVTTLIERPIAKRCFDGWSMAYRREPALNQFDSFPQVLGYLTDQVADLRLRGQIRQFAKSFIAQPVATAPELWRMAS